MNGDDGHLDELVRTRAGVVNDPARRCDAGELFAAGATRDEVGAILRERQARWLTETGWYYHVITGGDDTPHAFNAHTHGLGDGTPPHPDLQLVLPLPDATVRAVFAAAIDRIAAGRRFVPGVVVTDLLRSLPATFARAREGGREVLRVILPDPAGRLGIDGCEPYYARQYDGCLPEGER